MIRNVLLSLITGLIITSLTVLSPRVAAGSDWQVLQSNCCTIKYLDEAHLRTFTLRIGGFRFTSKGLDDNPDNIKTKVDEVMGKVQAILDMYPDDMAISIALYVDHLSIGRKFREFSETGTIPIAFYANKSQTIYVDISSVTDGVLAHEMAHAVINFYFVTPPPAKMQEILAQYVDLHLWD